MSRQTFTFVGIESPFRVDAVDWVSAGLPKLWRYNLHYFDCLQWAGLDAARKAALVADWIENNAPGAPDAWEPYPISLRAVNWIKWFWSGADPKPDWLASLAHQLAWLERNLEYHLLANHLLKNAKALVFGGAFFNGPDADHMRARGLDLMAREAAEQVLPDGGHYERSAMYHAIVLEDYLDVVNLLKANPGLASAGQLASLTATAVRATSFFRDILAGDGEIPLFNDAAFGITPPALGLLDYADRVLGADAPPSTNDPIRVCKADTGYFGYRQGQDSLLIDCGPGGPDYQPGHTHADTLSYELCLDGQRIVVDSGVHDYEASDLRRYLRGTAAHSTVRVDGEDQSEVWGAFRVARRARPLFAELGALEDGVLRFRGAHDGYRRLPGRVVHERRITASLAGKWDIEDIVTGRGEHRAESFIHLHPACETSPAGERTITVSLAGRPVVKITVDGNANIDFRQGSYCPEFGRKLANTVVVLSATARLPLRISYTIQRV